MKKHINIKIYGLVQGVFFRDSAREKAQELGLAGTVKNKPDGTVYVEAEGEEEKLAEFLNWCSQGPKWAEVEKVEQEISDNIENYKEFIIEY